MVVSSCEPAPNAFVLDKLTAVFESKGIETVFVFTKIDRRAAEDFGEIYGGIGYKTFMADNVSGKGTEEVAAYIHGKTAYRQQRRGKVQLDELSCAGHRA